MPRLLNTQPLSSPTAQARREQTHRGNQSHGIFPNPQNQESDRRRMSAMAMAVSSSSLNPNAAPFIPAAFRRVEDFSPEWWELVKTTAWFRDHWFRQHQMYEDAAEEHQTYDDVAALLPDDSLDLLDMVDTDDLFYTPDPPLHHHKAVAPGLDADVLRSLSLNSPRLGGAGMMREQQLPRHGEKPARFVGAKGGAARHVIHQPR